MLTADLHAVLASINEIPALQKLSQSEKAECLQLLGETWGVAGTRGCIDVPHQGNCARLPQTILSLAFGFLDRETLISVEQACCLFQKTAAVAARRIYDCPTFAPLRWTWKADLLLHDSIQLIADTSQALEQPLVKTSNDGFRLPENVLRISSRLRHNPAIVYTMAVARATTGNQMHCKQAAACLLNFGKGSRTECTAAVIGLSMIARSGLEQGGMEIEWAIQAVQAMHGLAIEQAGLASAFRGAVPVLSGLLACEFGRLTALAAAVCAELLSSEAFAATFMDGGLVKPLVALLTHSAGKDADAEILLHATRSMCTLTLDFRGRKEVVREGALEHLSDLLELEKVKNVEGNQRGLGGEEKRIATYLQCRRNAAEACLNVTAAEEFDEDVVPLILPLVGLLTVGEGGGDWATRRHAAGAIDNLTSASGLDKLVVDAGAIEKLVAIISSVSAGATATAWAARIEAEKNEVEILLSKQAAACAIQNLSAVFERLICEAAGALQGLLGLLAQPDLKCKQAASSALANLSLQPGLRQSIVAAGAVQPLVTTLLMEEKEDGECKQHTSAALWDLSAADERLGEHSVVQVREEIVQAGGIAAAISLLTHSMDDCTRENAAGILWNLCLRDNAAR
jgi:hypothetical protein